MGNDQTLNELKRRLAAGELTQAQFDRLQAAILARFGDESDGDYQPPSGTRLDNLHAGLELGPPDDRYRLVKRIGRGGMGHVWLARALTEEHLLGKECVKALKLVHPQLQDDRPALERLKREAVRAKELNQEHIVNVFGWRQGADGWLFVVMEYLEGQDLALRLHQAGGQGLPVEEIRRLLPPMAAALDYAHGRKVLHRDLKPANVFLCTDGTVKLLDFGLAAELHSSASALKTGDTSGTCEYMAPEAHHGAAPTRAQDIYALTVVICELLIGRPPFTCAAAVNRRPGSLPKPDERLSDTVWQVLNRGLAYEPEQRFGSAGEMARELLAALTSGAGKATPCLLPTPRPKWHWVATAAVLLVPLSGIGWWWLKFKPQEVPTRPKPDVPAVFLPAPEPETVIERDRFRWQTATAADTIDAYQDYKAQCERCAESIAADQAIARLGAEQKAEKQAEELKAKTAELAQVREKQLLQRKEQEERDQRRWGTATSTDTITGYQTYKAQCERCAEAIAADQAIARLEAEDKARRHAEELKAKEAELARERAKLEERQAQTVRPPSPSAPQAQTESKPETKRLPFEPEMVSLPGGCFQMGSPASEPDRAKDELQHQVCVQPFKIGKYEVTQGEWQAVMVNTPLRSASCGDRCPMESVRLNEVQDYLANLNARTGKRYRLPTEVEWEYACRGGTEGELYCGGNDLDALAWFSENSAGKAHPVGQKAANAFGLYDMSGNVEEWTCSWYDKNYGGDASQCVGKHNTIGDRSTRGGSFVGRVRAAGRKSLAPDTRYAPLGFRVVED